MAMISLCIAEMRAIGYHETADILAVAKVDLLARLNGVTDAEMEALLELPCVAEEGCD